MNMPIGGGGGYEPCLYYRRYENETAAEQMILTACHIDAAGGLLGVKSAG